MVYGLDVTILFIVKEDIFANTKYILQFDVVNVAVVVACHDDKRDDV